jgi:hypothetical protein
MDILNRDIASTIGIIPKLDGNSPNLPIQDKKIKTNGK